MGYPSRSVGAGGDVPGRRGRARTGASSVVIAVILALLVGAGPVLAASPAAGGPVSLLTDANVTITGAAASDDAGASVAAAGDVNGDGRGDVIIGAWGVNAAAGAAYVVYGSDAPTTVSLASLGTRGFAISGAAANDLAGVSVAAAGDVNGDGRGDVIIGAWGVNAAAGAAYVVYGSDAPTSVSLASLGTSGFAISGAAADDQAGVSVAAAGDVDGDGRGDVIIGAQGVNAYAGAAYVVYGSAVPTGVSLATLGTRGFAITGAVANDIAGASVAAAGDVNGDGRGDVIIGAYGVNAYAGAAYVVYGSAAPTSVSLAALGTRGFAISGAAADNIAGGSVAAAGDVNGDGRDDVIIGAFGANAGVGAAYVVYGSDAPTNFPLASLGTRGFAISGAARGDVAGTSVAAAGDVNGDGRGDVIVGAYGVNASAGAAYVVDGFSAGPVLTRAPALSGEASTGRLLSADVGVWQNPTSLTFHRQWRRCNDVVSACDAVGGAMTASYPITAGDVGSRLELVVTATDSQGRSTVSRSAPSTMVAPARAAPFLDGTATVGSTVTCTTAGWPVSTTVTWLREATAVGTGSTYQVTPADAGHALACRADDHDPAGNATATSTPISIAQVSKPPLAAPLLDGTATVGSTLTCTTTGWPVSTTVTWLREATAVGTGSTYVVTLADAGHAVACRADDHDPAGNTGATSTPISIARALPISSSTPRITRRKKVLTCSPGAWQNATGITRQWLRDGEPIRRAIGATYRVTRRDHGHLLACQVTATNLFGHTTARSRAIRIR